MPIKHEYRHFYQGQWKQIRSRILEKARNRCELCGKCNGSRIWTYTWQTRNLVMGSQRQYHMIYCDAERTGRWTDRHGVPCKYGDIPRIRASGIRLIRVRLTVAHQNHDPADRSDKNLHAWCQWCHLHHDQGHHKETRSARKDSSRPLLRSA